MNDFESKLDAIRTQLYQQTKGMNNTEIAAVTNANAKNVATQYGIQIVKYTPASLSQKIVE